MRYAVLAVFSVLLAGCGGYRSTSGTSTATALPASIRVRLTAQDHHPSVGKHWHYEVRVTDSAGRGIPAHIHLQIVLGGSPVGQVGVHRVRNGIWQETIGGPGNPPFPARAKGIPLVFQAVVTAKGQTVKRNWPITVR